MALELHVQEAVADRLLATMPPGKIWPVGPIKKIVPNYFHNFIKTEVLDSFVADCTDTAQMLQDAYATTLHGNETPAVITFKKTDKVYDDVVKHLIPGIGVKAMKDIDPWILNVLIDWSDFDQKISSKPKNDGSDIEPTCTAAALNDAPIPVHVANEGATCTPCFWNNKDTKLLLEMYSVHCNTDKCHKTKKKMWTEIAKSMTEKYKCSYTWEQCQGRLKTLTTAYKKMKDHNRKSGNDPKHCPFEEELDEIYGSKPSMEPIAINSTRASCSSKLDTEDETLSQQNQDNKDTEGETFSQQTKDNKDVELESKTTCRKRKASSEVLNALNMYMKKQETDRENERRERKDMHKEKMKMIENLINVMKN